MRYMCSPELYFLSYDGRLLISKDNSHPMTVIIEKQPQRQISNKAEEKKNVLIIDAMCEVQALKKSPDTTKMIHLKELFVRRVKPKIDKYPESHVLFDTYKELSDFSLKDGAREQRAQNGLNATPGNFDIHDVMSLKRTTLREL